MVRVLYTVMHRYAGRGYKPSYSFYSEPLNLTLFREGSRTKMRTDRRLVSVKLMRSNSGLEPGYEVIRLTQKGE